MIKHVKRTVVALPQVHNTNHDDDIAWQAFWRYNISMRICDET